jgi:hypothetical protein
MKEYFFSGTLGDAFVAFCKLSSLNETVRVTRLCNVPGVNHLIKELSLIFPNIIFNEDYYHFDTIVDMRDFAFAQKDKYINIYWDGNGRSNEPDDPLDIIFEPHPRLTLEPADDENKKGLKIGIQLHSGARSGHQRALDIEWITSLIRAELQMGYDGNVEIYGIGTGYNKLELDELASLPNVTVKVSQQSIISWLSSIASLDFFVSPEGLAVFFALSQKVHTLNIYEDRSSIQRMPKEWRDLATSLVPQKKIQRIDNTQRYYPIAIPQALAIINSTINPDIS